MTLRTTRQTTELLGPGEQHLRVTRQGIGILGAPEAKLRVTRQALEYLFSETIFSVSVAESMSFTSAVNGHVDKPVDVTDTLTFTERLPTNFAVTISDVIAFSDSGIRVREGVASTILTAVDDASYIHLIQSFWPAGDYLTFTEVVDVECGNWKYVPEVLTFTESISWLGPRYHEINNYLMFQETIWNNNIYSKTVNDTLTFLHWAGRPYSLSIADQIVFTDEGKRRIDASDILTFLEVLTHGKGAVGETILTFNQVPSVVGDFRRTVDDVLGLGQSSAYYYLTSCIDKQYHPFVGESTVINQPTAPSNILPVTQGSITTRFQLQYPARGGAIASVTLRAPELDSHDSNAFTRINRETRGGKLVVFADPTWPKVNTLSCVFTGLTRTELNALQDFILLYIGEEILLTDWDGHEWIGVVLKPSDTATCDGKNKWSVGFEFVGQLLEYYNSGLSLTFVDDVDIVVDRRPIISEILEFNQDATVMVVS
jgi:hypothetical protein